MEETTEERWRLIKDLINASPFYQYMGMEVVEAKEGQSRLRMPVNAEMMNLYGTVHGGAIGTILDSSCGIALGTLLKEGETMVTVDMRINYVLPVREGVLIGEGKAVHRGRHTGVAQAEIRDEDGNLVAVGICTHYIQGPQ